MKGKMLIGVLALLVAGSLRAQQNPPKVAVSGGDPDDRASARLLYWNVVANEAAGQLAINYGRPVWKKEYEDAAKFDGITKGQVWRMGSNFWSNLYTDVPVKIGGKSIEPGSYFLGLQRSADGASWSLAFIDPVKVRKKRIDAFEIHKAPVAFTVPMTTEAGTSDAVEKLTITLSSSDFEIRKSTLKVAWGHLVLSAPVYVAAPE
ncbi:MAG TPA: DUF2911 domain-containing protein [Terriglobia bacterium]|jgi:hypothetical protein|nr:DUF2911 domain-containing protein [Terriglobia bacterium]